MFRTQRLLIVLFLMAIVVSACGVETPGGSQIYSVGANTVVAGVQRALNGCAGCTILNKGDMWLFSWQTIDGRGVSFFGLNAANGSALDILRVVSARGGKATTTRNANELLQFMQLQGWRVVAPNAVPQSVYTALKIATTTSLSFPVPMLIFVPGGGYPSIEQLLNPRVQG